MEFLKMWAEQIIVAVIVATVLEMILPSGNNKKYIKTVIGVYILFTILSPVLTNAFNDNLNLDIKKYEDYIQKNDNYQELSKKFEKANSITLENNYIIALKQDIQEKLKKLNYESDRIKLEVNLEDEENYGEIKSMEIIITKLKEKKQENTDNKISINNISITTSQKEKLEKGENITNEEKQKIAEMLSEQYGVNIKNITII